MTKKIIRLEDPDQVGIFRSPKTDYFHMTDKLKNQYNIISSNHQDMPTPFDSSEPLLREIFDTDYKCAYKNNEEFKNWMRGVNLRTLMEYDFRIVLLEVTECVEGFYQTIYKEEDVVRRTDISNLYL